jgi:ribosome-binding protein aMBF1 (putative translation factor)
MLSQNERKIIEPIKKEEAKEEPKPKKKFKSFAYRLFMERIVAGLSVKELSEAVGVKPETIKLLEKGRLEPTDFIISKIADKLQITKGKLKPVK